MPLRGKGFVQKEKFFQGLYFFLTGKEKMKKKRLFTEEEIFSSPIDIPKFLHEFDQKVQFSRPKPPNAYAFSASRNKLFKFIESNIHKLSPNDPFVKNRNIPYILARLNELEPKNAHALPVTVSRSDLLNESESVLTKEKARFQRIENMTKKDVLSFLETENISLSELKRRMKLNICYEPIDTLIGRWYTDTHPKFALMEENERDSIFITNLRIWFHPVPFGYNRMERNFFHKARCMADELWCLYNEWIEAQYWSYGPGKIRYSHLCSQFAAEIYSSWLDNGKPHPENHGAVFLFQELQAKRMLEKMRKGEKNENL